MSITGQRGFESHFSEKLQKCLAPFVVFVCLVLLIPSTSAKGQSSPEQIQEGESSAGASVGTGEEDVQQELVDIGFEDVDIRVFIKFVSKVTGRNFVVDPKVRGNVTVTSPTRIPLNEVYRVFQSVLEVHGHTTVEAGSVVKIVPSAAARGKGIKTGFREESGTAEDKFETQVIHLKYLSPDDAKNMLSPLVSKNSVMVSHPRSGTLIITDFLSNIQRLRRIIEAMDVPGTSVVGE
jgi:type II secretory pathway component GspD/PulD (secretin)